jgi:hypothetical protein
MSIAAHAAPRRRQLPRINTARLAKTTGRALARVKRGAVTVRSAVLQTAGLGALSTAAWGVDWRAGAAAAGLSLLLLEWLTGPGDRR